MIGDEHFATLRRVREESAILRAACMEIAEAGSLLHIAYDPGISQHATPEEAKLLSKLRVVQ